MIKVIIVKIITKTPNSDITGYKLFIKVVKSNKEIIQPIEKTIATVKILQLILISNFSTIKKADAHTVVIIPNNTTRQYINPNLLLKNARSINGNSIE